MDELAAQSFPSQPASSSDWVWVAFSTASSCTRSCSASHADERRISTDQRRKPRDQHALGRALPRDDISLRRARPDRPLAGIPPDHIRWSSKLLVGSILMGFGIFNLVEGIIDHHLLGIHHVNETVPREQWIYWDLGSLGWGAAMLIGGWLLVRAGRRETQDRTARNPARP
jgi:hypothetical protein